MRHWLQVQRVQLPFVAATAALAAIAFAARLIPLLRGGGLTGIIDYDDSVYFGSAVAWLDGRVPYRDFLLLHPPGILYVLAPFASLGGIVGDATAFGLARLAFMLLGAVNTVLVVLIGRRLGRVAGLGAGALYAVWLIGAYVERTTWLIAPQNTLLLLALLVLRAPLPPPALSLRRVAVAGALLGAAVGIQLWGIVPLGVIATWVLIARRSGTGGGLRPALALIGGAVLALVVVCLPFLLAAGAEFLRYIVTDQVDRFAAPHVRLLTRVRALEGLTLNGNAVAAIVVAVAFAALWAGLLLVAWRWPVARLWIGLLAVQTAVLLVIPVFFRHYAGWVAPAGALAVGEALAVVRHSVRHIRLARPALPAVYAAALGVLLLITVVPREGTTLPAAAVTAELAGVRCVTADSPVLLIVTGTLRRDIANGCPLLFDPSGSSYDDVGRGVPPRQAARRGDDLAYQQQMAAYYGAGDAALFSRLTDGDSFQPQTWMTIHSRLPIEINAGPVVVLLRSEPLPPG
jgi:alpha-1,2-mannosyltransferase